MQQHFHLMVDLETLAVGPCPVVLSIGAAWFDPYRTPFIENTFYRVLETQTQIDKGLKVDLNTMKWWAERDFAIAERLFHEESTMVEKALCDFEAFIWQMMGFESNDFWIWAKPKSSDLIWLDSLYRAFKLTPPFITHRQGKCLRDLIDIYGHNVPAMKQESAHHALRDALWQAEVARDIIVSNNLFNDKEIPRKT